MTCSQCNKPAVLQLSSGEPLCVEHYSMLNSAINEQQRNSMAMMNYLGDQINEIMGVPPSSARINIPTPIVSNNPITYNNIHIDRSVVGAVNTAQVGRIDIAMDNINNAGHEDVGRALKVLTEAVINSQELDKKERNQVLEELAFLAEQATIPKDQRQKSVVKMVLKALPLSLATAVNLTTLWTTWSPTLHSYFK